MQIHRLPIPTPFPIGPVNAFLLDGDPLTLVDGGPDTGEAREALERGVRQAGRRVSEIRRVLVTHAHEDHFGLARFIVERSDAEVFAHPWEIPRMLGRRDVALYRRLLGAAGVPPDEAAFFESRWGAMATLAPPLDAVRSIGAGERVAIGEEAFEVLHTPGHTPGSICLFSRALGVLIAGDTVLEGISPNPILNLHPEEPAARYPSLVRYIETLDRLAALGPASCKTGHGDEVRGLASYVERHHAHVEARQARALEALDPSQGSTAWEVAGRLFPDAVSVQRFLTLSEAVANLDLAVARGAASIESANGLERFRRIAP